MPDGKQITAKSHVQMLKQRPETVEIIFKRGFKIIQWRKVVGSYKCRTFAPFVPLCPSLPLKFRFGYIYIYCMYNLWS